MEPGKKQQGSENLSPADGPITPEEGQVVKQVEGQESQGSHGEEHEPGVALQPGARVVFRQVGGEA